MSFSLEDPAGSKQDYYGEASRAAWVGLGINLLLGVGKLTAGILGNAFAMISDAVNSLGDSLTSVVVLAALHIAQLPPDEEHPYGHSRAEAIAGSSVALLIIFAALGIGWEALQRFGLPHDEAPAWWLLVVAAANVVIKEGLYRYKSWVGERTGSSALLANAWDHRSDALCSLAVLIGLAAVRWGGAGFAWADDAAALAVAGAILFSGVQLYRKSADELLDAQAPDDLVAALRATALAIPGVREIEQLRIRKSGLEYFADIHVEVDSQMTVASGHAIGHDVKDRLLADYPLLRDVLVHLEPHPHVHPAGEAQHKPSSRN